MHFISSRLSLLFDGCLAGWFRTVWWVHLEMNGKTELLPVQTVIVDAQQHSLIFIMLLFSARDTSTRKLSHVKTNMPWTVAMSHPVGTACLQTKLSVFFRRHDKWPALWKLLQTQSLATSLGYSWASVIKVRPSVKVADCFQDLPTQD